MFVIMRFECTTRADNHSLATSHRLHTDAGNYTEANEMNTHVIAQRDTCQSLRNVVKKKNKRGFHRSLTVTQNKHLSTKTIVPIKTPVRCHSLFFRLLLNACLGPNAEMQRAKVQCPLVTGIGVGPSTLERQQVLFANAHRLYYVQHGCPDSPIVMAQATTTTGNTEFLNQFSGSKPGFLAATDVIAAVVDLDVGEHGRRSVGLPANLLHEGQRQTTVLECLCRKGGGCSSRLRLEGVEGRRGSVGRSHEREGTLLLATSKQSTQAMQCAGKDGSTHLYHVHFRVLLLDPALPHLE